MTSSPLNDMPESIFASPRGSGTVSGVWTDYDLDDEDIILEYILKSASDAKIEDMEEGHRMNMNYIDKLRVKLEAADMLATALRTLAPFELVQGDTIKRLQPHSGQVLNTNTSWAVSREARSAREMRDAISALMEALAQFEGVK